MPSLASPVKFPTYSVCGSVGETRTSCGPSRGGNPGRAAQVRAPSVDLNSDTVKVEKSTASTYRASGFDGSTAQSRGNINGPIGPVDRQLLPRSSVRKWGRPRARRLKLYTVAAAERAWQKPLANGSMPTESTKPFIARCQSLPPVSVRWKPGLPDVASAPSSPARATPSLVLVKNNPGSGVTSLAWPAPAPTDTETMRIAKQDGGRMFPPHGRKARQRYPAGAAPQCEELVAFIVARNEARQPLVGDAYTPRRKSESTHAESRSPGAPGRRWCPRGGRRTHVPWAPCRLAHPCPRSEASERIRAAPRATWLCRRTAVRAGGHPRRCLIFD